jgi:hypothetical protein
MTTLSRVVLQLHRHHLRLALSEESVNSGGLYEASIVTSLHCATKVLAVASASYELLVGPSTIADFRPATEMLLQGMLVDRISGFTYIVSEAAVRDRRIVSFSVSRLTSASLRQLLTYTITSRCQRSPLVDTGAAVAQLEDASEAAHKWLGPGGVAVDLLVRVTLYHFQPR